MENQIELKKGYGICPVCNGSGRASTADDLRKYAEAYGWYGYSKEDDKCTCTNCGAQTMYGRPTGQVPLREDGTPCEHKYESTNTGRCLTRYKCVHCVSVFDIDSSG
jgi:hypothetical protein